MSTDTQGTAFQRFGDNVARGVERWMPSPFLFAIILTYIVFLAGVVVEGRGPSEMVSFWSDGFWNLLTFAMQMVLILMTGFVLAYFPAVNRGIQWLTTLPRNAKHAVVLVGLVGMVLGWIHWGIGLIVGAIFAREMGRRAHERGIDVHYPLLCVAGYMGLGLTWHWGLSSSAGLLMNTPNNFFIEQGIVDTVVGTSQTIFHPYTLTLTVLSIVYASIMLYLLTPTGDRVRDITKYLPEADLVEAETVADEGESLDKPEESVPADRIDNSKILGGIIAITGVLVLLSEFYTQGLDALNLNVVNFGFLFIGLALYLRPAVYRERFGEAAEAAAGIVLLFPFFAGIMGMMNASGLSETIADALISLSTPTTFPAIAWITAGFVNIFVPSGGGEWAVIGASILTAAQDLGVPVGKATMAYAVGDAHTNLFQPFWAIPLLAITGIKAREMFGYAVLMLLLLIPFLAVALIVIPY